MDHEAGIGSSLRLGGGGWRGNRVGSRSAQVADASLLDPRQPPRGHFCDQGREKSDNWENKEIVQSQRCDRKSW